MTFLVRPEPLLPARKGGLLRRLGLRRKTAIASSGVVVSGDGSSDSSKHLPLKSNGAVAERFVELAAILTTGHINPGRRAIAVCGAAAGAGASFASYHLAIALAASGVRTRLVDADMRSPCLHEEIIGATENLGLSDYLLNENLTSLDSVSAEVSPSLFFTSAGGRAAEASDSLPSRRFNQFVAACLRDAECTIFDTSPANRSADSRVVAAEAGYALVVARQSRTYFDDVSTLCLQLRQQKVVIVGSILNGI